MKNILLLLAIILPLCVGAQTYERSLSAGFLTTGDLIKPYGVNQWLLAGWSSPEVGAYFQDTLYFAILDQNGALVRRQAIKAPVEEGHYWRDIVALPDGGIFAVFESSLCDVASYIRSLQRFDNQGNLLWDSTSLISYENPVPDKWYVAPDGNLLGVSYRNVWKLDPQTGHIIFKAELQGVSTGAFYVQGALMIQGTEDLIATGTPSFQVWKKTGSTDPHYVLVDSLTVPGYRAYLTAGPNGDYYAVQTYPEKWLEKVDLQLNYTKLTLLPDVNYGFLSLAFGEKGLYLAEFNPPNSGTLRRFDFSGNNPVNLFNFGEKWRNALSICARNGKIAVAGTESSASPNATIQPIASTSAWVRIFDESQINIVPLLPDITLSNVKQTTPIDTSYPGQFAYSLDGGGFQIQVTNTGLVPVNQVAVNISFARNEYFDICVNYPAKHVIFKNLQLAPGASTLLGFGNVHADGQIILPAQLCFWTSSPNELPDAEHSNDIFCKPISYKVGVNDMTSLPLEIRPNPADTRAELLLPENHDSSSWQVYNSAGALVQSGDYVAGTGLVIETASLPEGMYFVRVGEYLGKLFLVH